MGAEEERRGKRGGERTEEEEASMDLNHMARRNTLTFAHNMSLLRIK